MSSPIEEVKNMAEQEKSELAQELDRLFAAYDALPENAQKQISEVVSGKREETPADIAVLNAGYLVVEINKALAEKQKPKKSSRRSQKKKK